MTKWSGAGVGLILLTLAALCASAASPKRVLILDAYGREAAPLNVPLSAFRSTLAGEFGAPLEFYEISLDRARFPEPAGPDPFVEFLESRIKNHPMDLVATFGGPGTDFLVQHHKRFFPDTPIVFMAGPRELSRTGSLKGKAAQVTHTLSFAGMVEDILQLQPQTTNIVVVIGASPLERVTMNNCRREFQSFTNRVTFTWLNDLPLEQVLERCATLPPRSFILHVLFLVDVAGTPFDRDESLRRLHAVANAPVFGYCASELGLGPIGGRLYQDSEIGVQAARIAIRILRGESPESIPVLELKATTPVYDGRELQRWGISESHLPPGSIVQYRQLTFWEQYRWIVAGVLVFCGLQTALIMGLVVNRAKRLRGEAALRESEERMILAAEAANLGVWIRDFVRNEVWATDKWRKLFGFPPSERLQFDHFLQRLHPEDREEVRLALANSPHDDGHYEKEYRVVLPDGQMRWISSRGRVEFDRGGEPVRSRGVSADITLRKQAEEKFRLTVEASPNGIVLTNHEGRILLVNAETEKLFGYARAELIGRAVETLLPERYRGAHPGHRAAFHGAPQARAMGAGRELFARRKDGTEFPVEIGLSPIQSEEGLLVLTAIVDISQRKRAEAEVQQQRAELTHLLRVSMLGELAGSLAHELNQPLTAVLSNAQAAQRYLAHDQPNLDEVREILADIVAEDKRAGEIIYRLRTLLKKGEVQRQPLDVNEIVQEVLKLVRSDLVNQNFMAQTELAPDLPVLCGDRVQLQQVLLNLVMNACDAMAGVERDFRQLTIRTGLDGAESVRLSVADCGAGIAPEKLEQVFESFYTTKKHGLGLGLAVCRTIVTAHGGKLWATRNPERGATFHFTLPLPGKEPQ